MAHRSSRIPRPRSLAGVIVFLTVLALAPWQGATAMFRGTPDEAVPFPKDLGWLNVERPLSLKDLRGKVVVLDFWTYGCINCVHVMAELERLKAKYGNRLAIVAVHSPKFENEKNLETLRKIVLRYDRQSPVVQDAERKLWQRYGVWAWPTLIVLSPDSKPVARYVGEGHYEELNRLAGRLLRQHAEIVDPSPLPMALEKEALAKQLLAFPSKIAVNGERVAIADTLHHRVILASSDGAIEAIYGGEEGFRDGAGDHARFRFPRGLAFADDRLYVADTGNHAVRRIDLETGRVETAAGTGQKARPSPGAHDPEETGIASPWGLLYEAPDLYIAMAGSHQIWRLDTAAGRLQHVAGSGGEGLRGGAPDRATFAQPSGLARIGDRLYVADPEGSAVRSIDLAGDRVDTLIGTGLFTFGDRDGAFSQARLQHVLGITALDEQTLLIADTYNHRIKRLDLQSARVKTIAGTGRPGSGTKALNEPGGIAAGEGLVLVADTNNHRILTLEPATGELATWTLQHSGEAGAATAEGTPAAGSTDTN